jgi:hypothetical protein
VFRNVRWDRQELRRIASTALCLWLSGCVSVPLSTIVRMATFDERDFVQLDPDVIRVRLKLVEGFVLDPGKSTLGVKIASEAGDHFGEFKLDKVTESRAELAKGMFSSDVMGNEYTLKLAAQSKKEFRKLQSFVGKGRPGQVTIFIAPILSSYPKEARTTNVWIDLLLSVDDGFFTLLDGAEVPMGGIRAANDGR